MDSLVDYNIQKRDRDYLQDQREGRDSLIRSRGGKGKRERKEGGFLACPSYTIQERERETLPL
jgi:hypothetical protein